MLTFLDTLDCSLCSYICFVVHVLIIIHLCLLCPPPCPSLLNKSKSRNLLDVVIEMFPFCFCLNIAQFVKRREGWITHKHLYIQIFPHDFLFDNFIAVCIFLKTPQWKPTKTRHDTSTLSCSVPFIFMFILTYQCTAYSCRGTCNKWKQYCTHPNWRCSQSILPGGCRPSVST